MAIHPDFPGLEVIVIVNKKPVKEYDVPENAEEVIPPSHTIKYIEATPGENFLIGVRVKPHMKYIHHDLRFSFNIDGVMKKFQLSHKDHHVNGTALSMDSIKFAQDGQIMKRKFVFSQLDTGTNHDPYSGAS
jgi:hypothetical protein